MSRWFLAQGAALWAFIALAVLQFGTDHLVDRDSYYHARYAQLMPERGLSREFPWAQEIARALGGAGADVRVDVRVIERGHESGRST